jgi:cardiolipin synthase A/B
MFHRRLTRSVLAVTAAVGTAAALGLTASAGQAATRPAASSDYTLYTLPNSGPQDGMSWFYGQINDATSSIDLTMYELQDTTAEDDLAAAESRGVDVRVILDQREKSENREAYSYLHSHGVGVVWSWSKYYFTHEKSMVIDGTTADVMTLNLQSQYYSSTRDYAVVDTNPSDVSAITATFNADYAHTSITPSDGADLVWSPTDSQKQLTALINGAKYSLDIYANEMDDTTITDDIADAAKRGVKVEVVGENEDGEYDSEYNQLYNAGVKISYYSDPEGFYIHAKGIVADLGEPTAKVFLGSENFSNTSLNENRELGLIIEDTSIESSVAATFAQDYTNGTKWT